MIYSSVGGDIVSTNSKVSFPFPPKNSGNGFTVSGIVHEIRNHTVQDSTNKYHRYVAVVLDVQYIRIRTFDSSGKEIEQPAPKIKKFGKGYLNHFGQRDLEDPNSRSSEQFRQSIGGQALPLGWFDNGIANLDPKFQGRLEFWGDSNLLKSTVELNKGSEVRLKTKGDSIFIESIGKTEASGAKNFSGENVVGGWTSKIGHNPENESKALPGQDLQGVDESEWD